MNEFLNNIQAILKILSQTPKQLYINLFKGLNVSLSDIIKKYKKYINLENNFNKQTINDTDNIQNITKKINILLNDWNNFVIKIRSEMMKIIENNINKEKNDIIKNINENKIKAINDNIFKLEQQLITVKNNSINESIRQMENNLNQQKESALRDIPYYNRNEASSKIDKEISRRKEEMI